MKLKDLMTSEVISIGPEADLVEAARLMRKHHVGFLVVIEAGRRGSGTLAGVLTDRDIVVQTLARDVDAHAVTVRDIMTTEVLTGKEDEDVATLLTHMRRAGIHRVPVIDGACVVRGVVSIDDILRYVAGLTAQIAETVRLSRRVEKRKHAA